MHKNDEKMDDKPGQGTKQSGSARKLQFFSLLASPSFDACPQTRLLMWDPREQAFSRHGSRASGQLVRNSVLNMPYSYDKELPWLSRSLS